MRGSVWLGWCEEWVIRMAGDDTGVMGLGPESCW